MGFELSKIPNSSASLHGWSYSPEIKTIIEAHANTFRAAKVF
jgi:hypothetical protein